MLRILHVHKMCAIGSPLNVGSCCQHKPVSMARSSSSSSSIGCPLCTVNSGGPPLSLQTMILMPQGLGKPPPITFARVAMDCKHKALPAPSIGCMTAWMAVV